MVQVELNNEERQVLVETVERALSDLSVEIADTDKLEYRDMLKARRDRLTAVLQKIQPTAEV